MRSDSIASPCSSIRVQDVEVGAEVAVRPVAACSMDVCGGRCCRFGAIVEAREQARIEPLIDRLLPLLRPEARQVVRRHGWVFRQQVRERYADPSLDCRATRVATGLCVFVMDRDSGGCALHQLALEDGVPVEQYKPRECVLFPLTDVVNGRLHLHRWPGYPCTSDSPQSQPVWQTFAAELKLILGDEGYQSLTTSIRELEQAGVRLEPAPYDDPAPVPRGRPPGTGAKRPPDTGACPSRR